MTWLTRIVVNEARGRLRKRRPTVGLEQIERAQEAGAAIIAFPAPRGFASPEAAAESAHLRRMIEAAIDELSEPFRLVFIMRDVKDRKSVVKGKSVSVRVDRGGRRIIKKKTKNTSI